jgi:hypothetical protein
LRTAYPILFPFEESGPEGGAVYRFDNLFYGINRRDGRQRLFIANLLGELVSADLYESKIDPWSIRALGLLPHEFLFLALRDIANAKIIFTSQQFLAAGRLRDAELHLDLNPSVQSAMRVLAEVPQFLANRATNGCGPEGLFNVFVPNLAYQECCNAHDVCYARGGTEADRARCDEDLARCMDAIGGGGLAPGGLAVGFVSFLYYGFVTVFGPAAFTYGPGATGATPAHKTGEGHGGGGGCSWTLRFVDLDIKGADDDTFTVEVVPDLERQTQTNPGSIRRLKFPETKVKRDARIRFSSDPISVKYGTTTCGAGVTVTILANAIKRRRLFPDLVVGDEQSKSFTCDGGQYDFAIELSLSPATVTFNFVIETNCA